MQNKLTWRSKLSFGMGGFGKDLVYAIVSTYFMKYLTDVRLVDPMFVAVLFVVARIWDAFNDPFMGMIVDNTRSRWGKFRPWILIGTLLNAVVLVLLYLDVDLPASQYAVYVGIMYLLWGMAAAFFCWDKKQKIKQISIKSVKEVKKQRDKRKILNVVPAKKGL